ncbi:unnamed protein product [Schistocephalus solidus]|uniref:Uncharacterized protein n=1 Tax=Schistocephalus solidus TaxID=70667 RepID=A0A183TJ99_SCHSO|nr:unnamed protein product [Schistocephalus solidus]
MVPQVGPGRISVSCRRSESKFSGSGNAPYKCESDAIAGKATTLEKLEDFSEREWPNKLWQCGEMTPNRYSQLIRRDRSRIQIRRGLNSHQRPVWCAGMRACLHAPLEGRQTFHGVPQALSLSLWPLSPSITSAGVTPFHLSSAKVHTRIGLF